MSARLLHGFEQKSDSPAFADFQQSIHNVEADPGESINKINIWPDSEGCNILALSRHVFPQCGNVFPSMTTLGLFLQY